MPEATAHDAPPGLAPPASAPRAGLSFEATLRVDERPSGKKFQGVWLERDDGERWVIAYRPEACWLPFNGARVSVSGERYEPEGQAIMAVHFNLKSLKALDDTLAGWTEIKQEREYRGQFEELSWEKGTKLEGERTTLFVAEDGTRYFLANLPEPAPEFGKPVTVIGREALASKYSAHAGGPFLYVGSVSTR